MQKVKFFTTSNKKLQITQTAINDWIEKENITIHQISTTHGLQYPNEVEIFITILYSKEN